MCLLMLYMPKEGEMLFILKSEIRGLNANKCFEATLWRDSSWGAGEKEGSGLALLQGRDPSPPSGEWLSLLPGEVLCCLRIF